MAPKAVRPRLTEARTGRRREVDETPAIVRGTANGAEEGFHFLNGSDWAFALFLAAAVFVVYLPCWRGGVLWDDNVHITPVELRSWHGLYRIWTDVRATSQYYPLLHSAFWLEHALWGDLTLGYHLTNLALHSLAAVLVLALLRKLNVPGVPLAAAIFALHPVQVESVAWMTEQKNTLSAVFYLSAALAYLHFDRTRNWQWYAAAAALFLMALLSKTVTGTLPAALLVVFWWQRGRLSWRNDVLPLAPLLLLGAGFAAITAWWELDVNRCTGPEFAFTPVQRLLIAGRTVWFCCGKLFWPAHLTFIYPRWRIDSHAAWQYVFPLSAAAVVTLAWSVRRWSRGPLAAVLYFGGTLVPVLGFFNLYTFRYSFVADHYQYLACLGIFTLFSAGAALLLRRAAGRQWAAGVAACGGIVLALAVLTWRQSGIYASAERLYRATIAGNPECWMAYNNLGEDLKAQGKMDDAIDCYRAALAIKPEFADPHVNLGLILDSRGNAVGAQAEYESALEIDPHDVEAHTDLGKLLAGRGQLDDAIRQFRAARDAHGESGLLHYNLGMALAAAGQYDEAVAEFRRSLEISPGDPDAQENLRHAEMLLQR